MGHTTLWLIAIALYFLPWIVASVTEKRNKAAIGVLNLLLGWTFIGWAIALVRASMKDPPTPSAR
ncbi:MAG TPA: superinfection immunity protein [Terriglobia bacterium]|nr:superinfection immunity protein [Terriglobia bacterium]